MSRVLLCFTLLLSSLGLARAAAVDPSTGRVLSAFAASVDSIAGLALVSADGRRTVVPTSQRASSLAIAAASRRAVALFPDSNVAGVLDLDTLDMRMVMTGVGSMQVVVRDGAALAYVIAHGAGSAPGSITEIDLRSRMGRTYPVTGFNPQGAALSVDGTRLFVFGTMPQPASPWAPGYVQAFDTSARTMQELPVPVGRVPRSIFAAPDGGVHLLGHLDAEGDRLQPVLFTLSDRLSESRRVALVEPAGRPLHPRAATAAAGHILHFLDSQGSRLIAVSLADGTTHATELESSARDVAFEAHSRRVLVLLDSGEIGVFSERGERIDTVRAGMREPTSLLADPTGGVFALGRGAAAERLQLEARQPGVVNFTDLWVDPAQPGWGVFVDQQGAAVFATLFVQDAAGQPTWLFMPNGVRQADGSFSGDLYRTRGPLHEAVRNARAAGTLRIEPAADGRLTLVQHVDGRLQVSSLQRFRFSGGRRECRWIASGKSRELDGRTDFTALWSNPADPGWGLAVAHQGDRAFAVLFTYDEENRPVWYAVSNAAREAAASFRGDMFRTRSKQVQRAGSLWLGFQHADAGVVRHRLDGMEFRSSIIRQSFAPLASHCENH